MGTADSPVDRIIAATRVIIAAEGQESAESQLRELELSDDAIFRIMRIACARWN